MESEKAGLNSEFSFSLTSCLTKAKEPSLSYYLPIAAGEQMDKEKKAQVIKILSKSIFAIW